MFLTCEQHDNKQAGQCRQGFVVEIKLYCFAVAMSDLVHIVETAWSKLTAYSI